MLNPDIGVLLITHYQRLLNYITPDVVHVLADGRSSPPAARTWPCASRRRATARSSARTASRRPPGRGAGAPPGARGRPAPAGGGSDDDDHRDAPGRRHALDPGRARAPTSRSSTRRCSGTGSSTSTRPRRRRSRARSSRRSDAYYRHDNANVHRGIYQLSERATAAYEGAREKVARLMARPTRGRSSGPATRPRRSTSSPTPGAGGTSAGGTSSSSPRWSTTRTPGAAQILAQEKDGDTCCSVTRSPTTGLLRLQHWSSMIHLRRSWFITHMSNTLGTINPSRDDAQGPRRIARATTVPGAVAFSTKGEYGVRLMVQLGRR